MGLHYVRPAHVHHAIPDHFPESPVEGAPPGPRITRIEQRILVVGSVLGFVLAAYIGHHLGGPRGMLLCLALFAFYFLLGWWPYFAAAHYRKQSHEDEE